MMHAHALSARERRIARLILDGKTVTQIARTLQISSYTAKDHIKAISRKVPLPSPMGQTIRIRQARYSA